MASNTAENLLRRISDQADLYDEGLAPNMFRSAPHSLESDTWTQITDRLRSQDGAFKKIYELVRELLARHVHQSLSATEAARIINEIRVLATARLIAISAEEAAIRADFPSREDQAEWSKARKNLADNRLAHLTRLLERSYLRRLLRQIDAQSDLGQMNSMQKIEDLFAPFLMNYRSRENESPEQANIIDQARRVVRVGQDTRTSRQEQLDELRRLNTQLEARIQHLQAKKQELESSIESAQFGQPPGSLSPKVQELETQKTPVIDELRTLHQLQRLIDDQDLAAIARLEAREKAAETAEMNRLKAEQERQARKERLIKNVGYRILINEGFDPDRLNPDLEGLEDGERQAAIEAKYRYIKSAILSLSFNTLINAMNRTTFISTPFGQMEFTAPSLPGEQLEVRFKLERIAEEVRNAADPDEIAAAEAMSQEMKDIYFFLGQWQEFYERHFKAHDSQTYMEAVPDDTSTQFLDTARIKYLSQTLPPAMYKLKSGGWVEDNTPFFTRISQALTEFFNRTRYAPGFLGNSVIVNLNRVMKSADKADISATPAMWRVADAKGERREFISPMLTIAPHRKNTEPVLGSVKNDPLLPAPIVAKGSTASSRAPKILQESAFLLPDSLEASEIHDGNPATAAMTMAVWLLETTGYSANVDCELPLVVKSSGGGFDVVVDEFGNVQESARNNLNVEGKHISQKLAEIAWISYKYTVGDEDRDPGRYGGVNRAALAVFNQPIPDFFEYALIRGEHPNRPGEKFIGTIRDWLQVTNGNWEQIPWDVLPGATTYEFAQARNHGITLVDAVNSGKNDPITEVMTLNEREGFIQVVNDPLVNFFVNLRRIVGYYYLGTYHDAQKRVYGDYSAEEAEIKAALGPGATDSQIQRKLDALKADERTKSDHFVRVIIRNAKTGELRYWDTTAQQALQLKPSILINQFDDSQISDIRDEKNPRGRHYYRWTDWQEAAELMNQDPTATAEIKAQWGQYANNPEDHPMQLLVVSVDPREGKSTTPNPQLMVEEMAFFDIIGAMNARGNIFQRMTRAQRAAMEILFSPEARQKFVEGYYENMLAPGAKKFLIAIAGAFGSGAKAFAESRLLNEYPPEIALPEMATLTQIRRLFVHFGGRSTLEEVLSDEKDRKELLSILNPFLT